MRLRHNVADERAGVSPLVLGSTLWRASDFYWSGTDRSPPSGVCPRADLGALAYAPADRFRERMIFNA